MIDDEICMQRKKIYNYSVKRLAVELAGLNRTRNSNKWDLSLISIQQAQSPHQTSLPTQRLRQFLPYTALSHHTVSWDIHPSTACSL